MINLNKAIKVFFIMFCCVFLINTIFNVTLYGFKFYLEGDGGYSNSFHLWVIFFSNLSQTLLITFGLLLTRKYSIYVYLITTVIIQIIEEIGLLYKIEFFDEHSIWNPIFNVIIGTFLFAYCLFYIKNFF